MPPRPTPSPTPPTPTPGNELDQMRTGWGQLQKDLDLARKELATQKKRVEEARKEVELKDAYIKKVSVKEREAQAAKKKLERQLESVRGWQTKAKELETENAELKSALALAQKAHAADQAQHAADAQKLSDAAAKAQADRASENETATRAKAEAAAAGLAKELASARERADALASEAALEKETRDREVAELKSVLERADDERKKLVDKLEDDDRESAASKQRADDAEASSSKASAELATERARATTLAHSLEDARAQSRALEAKLAAQTAEAAQAAATHASEEVARERAEEATAGLEHELKSARERADELARVAEADKDERERQLAELQAALMRAEAEREKVSESFESQLEAVAALQRDLDESRDQCKERDAKLAALETALEAACARNDAQKAADIEVSAARAQSEAALTSLKEQLAAAQTRADALSAAEASKESLERDVAALKESLSAAHKSHDELAASSAQLADACESATAAAADAAARADDAEAAHRATQDQLGSVWGELDELRKQLTAAEEHSAESDTAVADTEAAAEAAAAAAAAREAELTSELDARQQALADASARAEHERAEQAAASAAAARDAEAAIAALKSEVADAEETARADAEDAALALANERDAAAKAAEAAADARRAADAAAARLVSDAAAQKLAAEKLAAERAAELERARAEAARTAMFAKELGELGQFFGSLGLAADESGGVGLNNSGLLRAVWRLVEEMLVFCDLHHTLECLHAERQCVRFEPALGYLSRDEAAARARAVRGGLAAAFDAGDRSLFFAHWERHMPPSLIANDAEVRRLLFKLHVYFAVQPLRARLGLNDIDDVDADGNNPRGTAASSTGSSVRTSHPSDDAAAYPTGNDESDGLTALRSHLDDAAHDDLVTNDPSLLPFLALPQLARPWRHPTLAPLFAAADQRVAPPSAPSGARDSSSAVSVDGNGDAAVIWHSLWAALLRDELADTVERRLPSVAPPALLVLYKAYQAWQSMLARAALQADARANALAGVAHELLGASVWLARDLEEALACSLAQPEPTFDERPPIGERPADELVASADGLVPSSVLKLADSQIAHIKRGQVWRVRARLNALRSMLDGLLPPPPSLAPVTSAAAVVSQSAPLPASPSRAQLGAPMPPAPPGGVSTEALVMGTGAEGARLGRQLWMPPPLDVHTVRTALLDQLATSRSGAAHARGRRRTAAVLAALVERLGAPGGIGGALRASTAQLLVAGDAFGIRPKVAPSSGEPPLGALALLTWKQPDGPGEGQAGPQPATGDAAAAVDATTTAANPTRALAAAPVLAAKRWLQLANGTANARRLLAALAMRLSTHADGRSYLLSAVASVPAFVGAEGPAEAADGASNEADADTNANGAVADDSDDYSGPPLAPPFDPRIRIGLDLATMLLQAVCSAPHRPQREPSVEAALCAAVLSNLTLEAGACVRLAHLGAVSTLARRVCELASEDKDVPAVSTVVAPAEGGAAALAGPPATIVARFEGLELWHETLELPTTPRGRVAILVGADVVASGLDDGNAAIRRFALVESIERAIKLGWAPFAVRLVGNDPVLADEARRFLRTCDALIDLDAVVGCSVARSHDPSRRALLSSLAEQGLVVTPHPTAAAAFRGPPRAVAAALASRISSPSLTCATPDTVVYHDAEALRATLPMTLAARARELVRVCGDDNETARTVTVCHRMIDEDSDETDQPAGGANPDAEPIAKEPATAAGYFAPALATSTPLILVYQSGAEDGAIADRSEAPPRLGLGELLDESAAWLATRTPGDDSADRLIVDRRCMLPTRVADATGGDDRPRVRVTLAAAVPIKVEVAVATTAVGEVAQDAMSQTWQSWDLRPESERHQPLKEPNGEGGAPTPAPAAYEPEATLPAEIRSLVSRFAAEDVARLGAALAPSPSGSEPAPSLPPLPPIWLASFVWVTDATEGSESARGGGGMYLLDAMRLPAAVSDSDTARCAVAEALRRSCARVGATADSALGLGKGGLPPDDGASDMVGTGEDDSIDRSPAAEHLRWRRRRTLAAHAAVALFNVCSMSQSQAWFGYLCHLHDRSSVSDGATSDVQAALPLPPGWVMNLDVASGRTYFYCCTTGESCWDAPSAARTGSDDLDPVRVFETLLLAMRAAWRWGSAEPEPDRPDDPDAGAVASSEFAYHLVGSMYCLLAHPAARARARAAGIDGAVVQAIQECDELRAARHAGGTAADGAAADGSAETGAGPDSGIGWELQCVRDRLRKPSSAGVFAMPPAEENEESGDWGGGDAALSIDELWNGASDLPHTATEDDPVALNEEGSDATDDARCVTPQWEPPLRHERHLRPYYLLLPASQ